MSEPQSQQQPSQMMPQPDPRPKNFEKMYLDLLDQLENFGFTLQLQAKQSKGQYLMDKQARERAMKENAEGESPIGESN